MGQPSSAQGAINTLEWKDGKLHLIDQRKLPLTFETVVCETAEETAQAITDMVVRGAPAIGAAAAYGMVLGAADILYEQRAEGLDDEDRYEDIDDNDPDAGRKRALERTSEHFVRRIVEIGEHMRAARPTAVNLGWAVDRMLRVAEESVSGLRRDLTAGDSGSEGEERVSSRGQVLQNIREWIRDPLPAGPMRPVYERLLEEAHLVAEEDRRINRRIGRHGAPLLKPGGVLHHCNTGALATVDYGTALGVIRAAHEERGDIHVFPTETRPFMQGARLTAWELLQEGIPTTLITDGMAAHVMAEGRIQSVIVGADRITANGDVVNKIGTYGLAVLAKEHGIPFYVAAPISTLDLTLETGADVVIEERDGREVTHILDQPIAPEGVGVYNPAFDVTPAKYVTAIITEYGVVEAPYEEGLARVAAMAAEDPVGEGSGGGSKEAKRA